MLLESDDFIDSILEIKEAAPEKSNSQIIEKFSSMPEADPLLAVEKRGKEIEDKLFATHGRPRGTLNKSNEERANIGALARAEGDTAAAEKYGVSAAAANSYKNGKTTPAGPVVLELADAIETKIGRVRNKAVDHLENILNIIDTDTLLQLQPLDKIKAANGMAAIAAKIAPSDTSNERTLIIRVPEKQNELNTYEVRDITPEGHVLPSV